MKNESTALFLERNFDTAMKIHSICYDRGFTRQKSKLFTYMYVKMHDSGLGLDYFEADHSTEIDAIALMLGNSGVQDALVFDTPPTLEDLPTIIGDLTSRAIQQAELVAQKRYGIESPITPELLLRLKFHTDSLFRKNVVEEFTDTILSSIGEYTSEQVKESIATEIAQKEAQEKMINEMLQ